VATQIQGFLRQQLLERRHKLNSAVRGSDSPADFQRLLDEVDGALAKIDDGCYGLCEACHETIETDRLMADPLVRFCLDHLSQREIDALQRDLELAARVQRGLLPKQPFEGQGWHICYHYEPAGIVSGDYCDIVDAGERGVYFMVGDVSGKGVAASMLMAHLHAMFRSLISVGLSLECILEHASRVFAESTLPNQYATLVCGRAGSDGSIQISNAGHPAPLIARNGTVAALEFSGLPVGMFSNEEFAVGELCLAPGQLMVIYSDGVSEATDGSSAEYGIERLRTIIGKHRAIDPSALLDACRDDLASFRRDAAKSDDATLFVISRIASAATAAAA
jgi:sigma-B regulation protein RsbU (phosphoserine phosphatase)